MSTVLFLNNYKTTLAAALSSTATVMTVATTTGLPSSLASGQFIPLILTPASSPGSVYEIVYVTGISGANLTVTRGEENTSALTWNTGDILYSTNTAGTTQSTSPSSFTNTPYDIASGVSGPIGASQYVAYFLSPRSINIPANFSGSLASVLTSFTSAATFTIYHNGTSVGTISFAAGGTTGTFSTGSGFTLNPGDSLTIQAPSTADATAANLSIIIDAVLA
jgi:hypothetical protein